MSTTTIDELLADLRALVEIESPSHDVAAIERSATAVADLFERRTGRAAELVPSEAGPHVHWRGGDRTSVLLLGHHDTVFPLGTLARRPFTVDGGRATGPGVFDMKGGIVLAAHALASVADPSLVEVLITADEEVGSQASRDLLEERAAACGVVLVLEPAADGGALKIGRKGVGTFEVVVHGKAAHAGLEPEKGVNALVEAARQITTIAGFASPDAGTTVTPTLASAGTAENVVPAEATLRVDVRIAELGEKSRIESAFAGLTAVDPAATLTVSGSINRPPMPTSASADLFELAQRVAAESGLGDLAGVTVGGGSDGNFTAALGVATLDGLGAVGGGAHADDEWLDVGALPSRIALLVGLLGALRGVRP